MHFLCMLLDEGPVEIEMKLCIFRGGGGGGCPCTVHLENAHGYQATMNIHMYLHI